MSLFYSYLVLHHLMFFYIKVFIAASVEATPACVSRRCLANDLIAQSITSQPQSPNCSLDISLSNILYETLAVDTSNLIFTSILVITMDWQDPDLSWNTTIYPYNMVVLPIADVWTPSLSVINAVNIESEPVYSDLVVYSNGSVEHTIRLRTDVTCEINLFYFPFTADSCPVFLNGWSTRGCGTILNIGEVSLMSKDRGDWRTLSVKQQVDERGRVYLWVTVSLKFFKPLVTLVIPSVLIMLSDIVSFALPFAGGERNTFKVTLVLSFTMFLIILSDTLPGVSTCSPLIQYHYCICLFFLVVSMIESMFVSQLYEEGLLLPCLLLRWCKCTCRHKATIEDTVDIQDTVPELLQSTKSVTTNNFESPAEISSMNKVVKFLEQRESEEQRIQRIRGFATKVDQICFLVYISLVIVYAGVMVYMMVYYNCNVNHFDF